MTTLAAPRASAQPAPPDDRDKLIIDTLKDIHNRGADLYNAGDAAGGFRMYQGALLVLRPLLAHRPEVQKIVDDGLADVARTPGVVKVQAFHLHEVIEQVRAELKKAKPAAKPADETKPNMEALTEPRRTRPDDTETMPRQPGETPVPPKDKDQSKTQELARVPDPQPEAKGGTVSGKVMIDGKPAAGAEVTFVSVGWAGPRVFTAVAKADGTYAVDGPLPPGEYAVMVTPGGTDLAIPAKYQMVLTSGLLVKVTAPATTADLELKGS